LRVVWGKMNAIEILFGVLAAFGMTIFFTTSWVTAFVGACLFSLRNLPLLYAKTVSLLLVAIVAYFIMLEGTKGRPALWGQSIESYLMSYAGSVLAFGLQCSLFYGTLILLNRIRGFGR
jgi:hypothetical protein